MSAENISILVDNESWILPYAQDLVGRLQSKGYEAALYRDHADLPDTGLACFFLGCVKIAGPDILAKHQHNLVIHESDLPKGRGFAPISWQILAGSNEITFCLIEAAEEADAGDIYLKKKIRLSGDELCDELRDLQGRTSIEMVEEFLALPRPIKGIPQEGDPSYYKRRRPKDSELDINKTIAEQFPLLRIVDNERYPAFFEIAGSRYKLEITKLVED